MGFCGARRICNQRSQPHLVNAPLNRKQGLRGGELNKVKWFLAGMSGANTLPSRQSFGGPSCLSVRPRSFPE